MPNPKKELQQKIDTIFSEANEQLDRLEHERDAIIARCASNLDAKKAEILLKTIHNLKDKTTL